MFEDGEGSEERVVGERGERGVRGETGELGAVSSSAACWGSFFAGFLDAKRRLKIEVLGSGVSWLSLEAKTSEHKNWERDSHRVAKKSEKMQRSEMVWLT